MSRSNVPGTTIPSDRATEGLARPALVDASVPEHERSAGGNPKVVRVKVRRRARAACLEKMPDRLQRAAETYAAIYEGVQAGGGGTTSTAPDKVDGGPAKREGHQSVAIETVVKLRKMNRAIGDGAVALGRKGREVRVTIKQLLVLVAVGDASIPAIFDLLDVRRTAKRSEIITDAVRLGLERVADQLGL